MRAYPTPISASDILLVVYPESKMPSESNIRNHISTINKKLSAVTGQAMICPTFGQGYRIMSKAAREKELTRI